LDREYLDPIKEAETCFKKKKKLQTQKNNKGVLYDSFKLQNFERVANLD
jgi:hypothetical protein